VTNVTEQNINVVAMMITDKLQAMDAVAATEVTRSELRTLNTPNADELIDKAVIGWVIHNMGQK
jgi:hypothetical protein